VVLNTRPFAGTLAADPARLAELRAEALLDFGQTRLSSFKAITEYAARVQRVPRE
jgi:hypothetical protein